MSRGSVFASVLALSLGTATALACQLGARPASDPGMVIAFRTTTQNSQLIRGGRNESSAFSGFGATRPAQ
jgi:hypothetical protein